MKTLFLTLVTAALLVSAAACKKQATSRQQDTANLPASENLRAADMAKNPFVTSIYTADPSAHVWADGRLYVYPSHDIDPPRGCDLMDQYHVFSTDDMVHWTDHGEILRASQVPWGRPEGGFMWAPDCAYKNGKYYFYFPHPSGTDWGSTWKIGVATSTNPASGFTVQGYIPNLEPFIDPTVFVDDDGQAYFYYGGGGTCKGGKLKNNMMEIDGAMQTMQGLVDFHEASLVHKRNGVYYLSYSDNHDVGDSHNQMRYATSNSPLGPWTHRGIYMDPTDSYTNHGSIVEYKGQWYAFYHNSSISKNDWLRSICVDKLYYNADGTIQKVQQSGPTNPDPNGDLPIGQIITLKGANNNYVCSENGAQPMICNRPAVGGWEQFKVVSAGNGKVALLNSGKYVCSENGLKPMICDRPAIGPWEQFEWIKNTDGTISLKGNNGKFVSIEDGTQAMTCTRSTAQSTERFRINQ
ncbi:family 43 glycosylhydrolase [Chitinophaga sp. MD30]|uniref:family 43 glycosylhydrolase n=1 Tax=Chitinophaga sp. MD30 TaxID=2033437 RepID=UPI001E455F36|nr:family 43 glycosylhydrolase [Chitinophaga sp. MD30]